MSEEFKKNEDELSNCKKVSFENHNEKVLQRLHSQLANQQLCDVFLISGIDGKIVPAHRNILAACSDYFSAMFIGSLREAREEQIVMDDIHGDALEMLVQYCYTGCLELEEDKVETLLATANLLQLTDAVSACCQFMEEQLDPSNCIGISVFADQLNCDCLKLKAESFICENFMEVCENQEFFKLNLQQLGNLLSNDGLFTTSEEVVFRCIMNWVDNDKNNRIKHIPELLNCVRLPLIKPEFLVDNIKHFCKIHDCQALYEEAIEWHLLPERRSKILSKRCKPRTYYLNELLIVGGMGQTGWSYIESYCPLQNKWTVWKDNIFPNRCDYGAVVIKNELIVIGGTENGRATSSVKTLDLKTMGISSLESLAEPRSGVAVAILRDDIYAVGGYNSEYNSYMSKVQKWNSVSRKWSTVSNMVHARAHGGIAVLNEKLYVGGGVNGKTLSVFECYDPNLQKWEQKANMLIPRTRFGLVGAHGFVYAVGGQSLAFLCTESVERYDPKTDSWVMVCSLSCSRSELSCALLGERILAVGGKFNERNLNVVEYYDYQRNKWIPKANLNYNRAGACLLPIPKLPPPKLF